MSANTSPNSGETTDSNQKKEILSRLLERLSNDDIGALDEFNEVQNSNLDYFDKVEIAHEFIDLLTFKLKESKSTMEKEKLSVFSLEFLQKTLKKYGYNPKYVAVQCKALITYYQNQKNLDKAIEVCEFLISNGITDDDAKGFHYRLDELFRLKKKIQERQMELGDLSLDE